VSIAKKLLFFLCLSPVQLKIDGSDFFGTDKHLQYIAIPQEVKMNGESIYEHSLFQLQNANLNFQFEDDTSATMIYSTNVSDLHPLDAIKNYIATSTKTDHYIWTTLGGLALLTLTLLPILCLLLCPRVLRICFCLFLCPSSCLANQIERRMYRKSQRTRAMRLFQSNVEQTPIAQIQNQTPSAPVERLLSQSLTPE
jgi:hypothetical protein